MENNMAVLQNLKSEITTWFTKSTSGCVYKRTESKALLLPPPWSGQTLPTDRRCAQFALGFGRSPEMGRPGHGFQQHTAHSLGVSALPSRPTGTLPIPWGSRRFPAGPRHLVQEVWLALSCRHFRIRRLWLCTTSQDPSWCGTLTFLPSAFSCSPLPSTDSSQLPPLLPWLHLTFKPPERQRLGWGASRSGGSFLPSGPPITL